MHDGVATYELEALELEAVLLDFGTSYPNLAEAVIVEVGDVEAKI